MYTLPTYYNDTKQGCHLGVARECTCLFLAFKKVSGHAFFRLTLNDEVQICWAGLRIYMGQAGHFGLTQYWPIENSTVGPVIFLPYPSKYWNDALYTKLFD